MKIALTGGHITPALALIEEIRDHFPETEFIFFGRKYPIEGEGSLSFESREISNLGIKFINITTGRLQRKFTRYTLSSLLKLPVGLIQSIYNLIKEKPNIIVGFGGYLSVPVIIAGWIVKIPIITCEQTIDVGLANRINSIFARKIILSYPQSAKFFPKDKRLILGNPLRSSIFKKNPVSRDLKTFFKRVNGKKLIYVTGGNLGSHFLNQIVIEVITKSLSEFTFIIQVGDSQVFRDYDRFQTTLKNLPNQKSQYCYVTKFITSDDIGSVLNRADLIITRAGANIVSEVAALSKIAIFIPLPYAAAWEQEKNAKLLADLGSAKIISQDLLTHKILIDNIYDVFNKFENYQKKANLSRKIVNLQASQQLAKIVMSVVKNHG